MPTVTINALGRQSRDGRNESPAVSAAVGIVRIDMEVDLTDAQIFDPLNTMEYRLEYSLDSGLTWLTAEAATWLGGPENAPKVPGNPLPRPGHRFVVPPTWTTRQIRAVVTSNRRFQWGCVFRIETP